MTLTSWPFAAFLAAALAAYFLAGRRGQVGLLLAVSCAFAATWSWHAPLLLIATAAANHAIAGRLWARPSRALLAAGVGLNVALLVLLKYVAPSGDDATGVLGVLLPIGFSYRVLENVAFLVDASRRQLDAFPRLLDYALFATYFPKLLAGPIERGRAFLAQLPRGRVVDDDAVARAFTLIATGLFRKLVLADGIRAMMPASLFVSPVGSPGTELEFAL